MSGELVKRRNHGYMNSKLVYVAGPLFEEGERWWIEQIEKTITDQHFRTFLPHRDNPDKQPETIQLIFENNRDAIRNADLIVANLNGITTDDGTAWELGFAAALGKPSIGIFTDWRSRFEGDELVNLMISRSLDRIVRSLEELSSALNQWSDNN